MKNKRYYTPKQIWNHWERTVYVFVLIVLTFSLIPLYTSVICAPTEQKHVTYVQGSFGNIPKRDSYDCNVSDEVIEKATASQMASVGLKYVDSTPVYEKIYETEDLDGKNQNFAKTLCDNNNFPLEVFMSLMWRESGYNPDAVGEDGQDIGICQIRKSNHAWIQKECPLGKIRTMNFFDSCDSMYGSMFMLVDIEYSYGITDMNQILMYYNLGPTNAKRMIDKGIYSTQYSRDILEHAKTLGYEG